MGNSRWIGRGKQVEEAEEEEDMTGLRRRWERKAEEQDMRGPCSERFANSGTIGNEKGLAL